MKLAIIISGVASVVLVLLGAYISDHSKSGDDYAGAAIPTLLGMLSGCVFLALIIAAVARVIWSSL